MRRGQPTNAGPTVFSFAVDPQDGIKMAPGNNGPFVCIMASRDEVENEHWWASEPFQNISMIVAAAGKHCPPVNYPAAAASVRRYEVPGMHA